MREIDFSVIWNYRDTLILLPDAISFKKQKQKHHFGARPEYYNLEEMLQEL